MTRPEAAYARIVSVARLPVRVLLELRRVTAICLSSSAHNVHDEDHDAAVPSKMPTGSPSATGRKLLAAGSVHRIACRAGDVNRLEVLSDAAFKLYVFLCLNVDRHSGRMVWEVPDLASRLQCDRQSVADSLDELCRRDVCFRHPNACGRIAADRLSVEICDRYWPYEKAPVEEFGVDQDGYVQRVRKMLSATAACA